MVTEVKKHNGRELTIEIIDCYDWTRDYNYFSVYVAIKKDYQRYDVGKAPNIPAARVKANNWIINNL